MVDTLLYNVTDAVSAMVAADHNSVVGALQAAGLLYQTNFHIPGSLWLPHGFRPADMTRVNNGAGTYTVTAGKVLILRSVVETAAAAATAVTVGGVTVFTTDTGGTSEVFFNPGGIMVPAATAVVIPTSTAIHGFEIPTDSRFTPKVAALPYTVTTGKHFVILGFGNISTGGLITINAVNSARVPVGATITGVQQVCLLAQSGEAVAISAGTATVWGYEVNNV